MTHYNKSGIVDNIPTVVIDEGEINHGRVFPNPTYQDIQNR